MGVSDKMQNIKSLINEARYIHQELSCISNEIRNVMESMLNKKAEDIDIKNYQKLRKIDKRLRSTL